MAEGSWHGRSAAAARGVAGVLAAALVLGAAARADETEQRVFSIAVDGRPAGEARLAVTSRADGTEVVESRATVRVRFLLTYVYTYEGTEVWKGGRLQSLRGTCDDNGKRFEVAAAAEADALRVRVNGQERTARPDVWTTSFWKLPDARFCNQPVTLLDADRGQELARHLHYVGAEDLPAAGEAQKCFHFRVTGGPSPTELWFDGRHRLVREEFVEVGHRTVVQLSDVRR